MEGFNNGLIKILTKTHFITEDSIEIFETMINFLTVVKGHKCALI